MRKWYLYIFLTLLLRVTAQQAGTCRGLLNEADLVYFSYPDSSYSLSCQAELCAIDASDTLFQALAQLYKAKYLLLKSELEEANIEINKGLALYKLAHDAKGQAYALKLKAILAKRIGNQDESVFLTEKSLELYKSANDTEGIISSLLNVTVDYVDAKMYDKANLSLKETDSYYDYLSLTNRYYYYQNRGMLLVNTGKPAEALDEFKKAFQIAEKEKMIDSKATILMLMARAARLNSDYTAAETYAVQSKDVSEKNILDHELVEAYDEIILLAQEQNNYKQAFEYLKLQNKLKAEIVNIEKLNHISSLEKKLALSEKQKEIEQEKLKSQEEKAKNKQLMYVLIAIAAIALLAVFMFIRTNSLHRKISLQKKNLEIKNHIIEEKQKEIIDSINYARRIQQSLLPNEKYIDRILKQFLKRK